MTGPANGAGVFDAARECFEDTLGWLESNDAAVLTHAELEDELDSRGRELLRRMVQDHFSLRAASERRLDSVCDADTVAHGAVEAGHRRPLATIFGQVDVERLAYRHRGHPNLYPADAVLNLPTELHSHGLRRLAALEVSRGSFDEARAAVERATGQHVVGSGVGPWAGGVKLGDIGASPGGESFDLAFGDVLVISADGKGIVMRPDALRPATA